MANIDNILPRYGIDHENFDTQGRSRVSVDLSPTVMAHLEAISALTGATKSQLIHSALMSQLPNMITHAQGLQWSSPVNANPTSGVR